MTALPLAMTMVWLANMASLLLPVSCQTNLLAADRAVLKELPFARQMALPSWLPSASEPMPFGCSSGARSPRDTRFRRSSGRGIGGRSRWLARQPPARYAAAGAGPAPPPGETQSRPGSALPS